MPVITPASTGTPAAPLHPQRFSFIDALRGFALLGILFVNAVDIAGVGYGWAQAHDTLRPDDPAQDVLWLTVQTRFVPIFNTLFGMSLFFVLAGTRTRSQRPWLVMLRRVVTLLLIGAAFLPVYPGNILWEYGVVALLVLPLVLFTPRRVVLGSGVLLTVAAYVTTGGGLAASPGLMLLGAGMAAYGLPRALESAGRGVLMVFMAAAVATVPALLWQLAAAPGDPRYSTIGGIAGLVMAVLYTTGLALLWRTRARRVLAWFFEPLGRMALSNYIGAAVVIVLARMIVDFGMMTSSVPVLVLGGVLIVVQSVVSRVWLARFAYGPVEWLWRTATWMRPATWRTTPVLRGTR